MPHYFLDHHTCSGEAFIVAECDGDIVACAGPLRQSEEDAVVQMIDSPRDYITNMDAEQRAESAAWANRQAWRTQ